MILDDNDHHNGNDGYIYKTSAQQQSSMTLKQPHLAHIAKGPTSRQSQDLADACSAWTTQRHAHPQGDCGQDTGAAQDNSHIVTAICGHQCHAKVCKQVASSKLEPGQQAKGKGNAFC